MTESLTEKLAELETKGFEFSRRISALPFLDGLGIINSDGERYELDCPQELRLVLVYDKGEPVYLIHKKK